MIKEIQYMEKPNLTSLILPNLRFPAVIFIDDIGYKMKRTRHHHFPYKEPETEPMHSILKATLVPLSSFYESFGTTK